MKRILLMLCLALFVISCAPEQPEITEESFQSGLMALSTKDVKLDAGQTFDFFIGLENKFETNATFSIEIECVSKNCDNNVVVQAFPSVRMLPGKKAAFPAAVLALETAKKADYEFGIIIKQNNTEYASGNIKVEVVKSLEEVAKEAVSLNNK
jgi:uncharacterized protein (DUF608 family)